MWRAAATAGCLGLAGISAYANLIEPFNYEVTDTEVQIKNLPDRFEKFRITLLTDIHHSDLVPLGEVRRVVELARSTAPDLFALTGDYTTARRSYIEPCAEALGALAAHAPEGAWAVLGNHDHGNDPELTRRALKRRGINLLGNANTALRRGPDALQLTGIDDWSWAGDDWARALRGVDLEHPTVMLSHQPAIVDLPQAAKLALVLGGHTHGGQINLPLVGAPARLVMDDLKYLAGLYRPRPATSLYVSRGTGVVGLPLRLGARPEIAVITLRRQIG